MIVAFWNVNTGVNSFPDRLTTFRNWCAQMAPDLLLLEEASHTLTANVLAGLAAGYVPFCSVYTLDRHLDPSTKCLVALKRAQLDFTGHALRLPGLEAKRMTLKITRPNRPDSVWAIHANASAIGGLTATDAAYAYVMADARSSVGGDFNFPFNNSRPANSVAPLAHDGTALRFSQWRKEDGALATDANGGRADLHLDNTVMRRFRTRRPVPSPNGVIDFVIRHAQNQIVAQPNCPDQATWVNILLNFDHCPVVYDIPL